MCLKVTPLLKKWKVIRSCIPRRETTQQVYTRDLKEVADEFNQFFTSVGARASKASRSLLNVHNLVPLLAVVPDNEISEVDKFCFHPVSSREIQKIMRSLLSNKAPGHDKVSTSVRKLFHVFFQFLQLLLTVRYWPQSSRQSGKNLRSFHYWKKGTTRLLIIIAQSRFCL